MNALSVVGRVLDQNLEKLPEEIKAVLRLKQIWTVIPNLD
jgi:hypothetical protein